MYQSKNSKQCILRCPLKVLKPANLTVRKLLNELQFTCNNDYNGCKSEIMYEHLQKHQDNCEYEAMACTAATHCKTKGIKRDIIPHIKICEYVGINCENCTIEIQRREKSNHNLVCLKFKLRCDLCEGT